jgi:hypothetical protein
MDWKAQLLNYLVMALGTILTGVIPVLAAYIIKRLNAAAAAYGVQISAEQQKIAVEIANNAVAYAEEFYTNLIKQKLPTSGNPKLGAAVAFFIKMADQHGLPEMAEEEIEKLIEARLNMARDPTNANVVTLANGVIN